MNNVKTYFCQIINNVPEFVEKNDSIVIRDIPHGTYIVDEFYHPKTDEFLMSQVQTFKDVKFDFSASLPKEKLVILFDVMIGMYEAAKE